MNTYAPPLPENAFWGDDGLLYHKVETMSEGGTMQSHVRRLAQSQDEAIKEHRDFYHPTLGLIWEGYKLAKDRPVESIIKDSSEGGKLPTGEMPVPQALKSAQ